MSVILCSLNCGALRPATTLFASVRKTRVPTSRPVGVSRGISHVPISGAASAGVSGAGAGFVPGAPLAGAAGLLAAGLVAWPWVESSLRAARAELLRTNAASNKDVGILRRSINDLLGTGKMCLNDCTCSCCTPRQTARSGEKNDECRRHENAAGDDERHRICRRDLEVGKKRLDGASDPHPADPSSSGSDDDRRHDEQAEREHRLTMGDAVGGEGVDADRTRDEGNERDDAENRLAVLQEGGLTGIEVRLDSANRRHWGGGIDLADLRSDGIAEPERIARRANDK